MYVREDMNIVQVVVNIYLLNKVGMDFVQSVVTIISCKLYERIHMNSEVEMWIIYYMRIY